MLDDCVSYLDGTIYNIESKITNFDETETLLESDLKSTELGTEAMKSDEFMESFVDKGLSSELQRKLTISSKF